MAALCYENISVLDVLNLAEEEQRRDHFSYVMEAYKFYHSSIEQLTCTCRVVILVNQWKTRKHSDIFTQT